MRMSESYPVTNHWHVCRIFNSAGPGAWMLPGEYGIFSLFFLWISVCPLPPDFTSPKAFGQSLIKVRPSPSYLAMKTGIYYSPPASGICTGDWIDRVGYSTASAHCSKGRDAVWEDFWLWSKGVNNGREQ